MSGPEKSGNVVYGAILFPRLLVHSRQNYRILYLGMQQRSENGNHRYFIRLVALIFRLNVGYFCLFGCGWIFRLLLILGWPKVAYHLPDILYSNNYTYLVQVN